jgi:serine/threonine-protein kinase
MRALIGSTIGNYVVQGKIGEGGMGVVYVAEHPRIGRKVAIKVLLPEYSQNEEVVSRFFTEARASSAIKNEHIIDIIDFGELPDKASYIIMEWLEGEPLSRVLDREGMLELPRAIHIARGIGKALAAAHARNIVHRDLKPDNVFLVHRGDDTDFVKVLDFGIAKLLVNDDADAKQISAKTRTGSIIGTPTYMSPEQCRGVAVDARSDVYSLGVIVYQMIVGRVPFEAEGLGDLLLKHMTEPPRPLRELAPSVPESVEHAVLRALEKDPAQRYASVVDFVRDLGAPITSVLVASRSSELPTPPTTAGRAAAVGSIDTIGGASGEAVSSPPAPRSRGGAWLIMVPVALAGVAVLAFTLYNAPGADHAQPDHKDAVKPAATNIEPARPTPTPPTPVPTKPPMPATVRFAVRTIPTSAHLLVNGVEQHNPYLVDVVADGKAYDLQIDAPGFAPYHSAVKLDVAQDLEIVLEPKKGTHAHVDSTHTLPKPPPLTTTTATTTHVAAPTSPIAPPTPNDAKKDDRTYKGTKGTLITDYPESK